MYKTILVTLDASPTDRVIIEHIKQLAKEMNSSVVLFHVATGVPAQFHGPDAGGRGSRRRQRLSGQSRGRV